MSQNRVIDDVSKINKCEFEKSDMSAKCSNNRIHSNEKFIDDQSILKNSLTNDEAKSENDSDQRYMETVQDKSTGFAFTINFDEEKLVDERKLKEMTEHFQNRLHQQEQRRRHRRGESLSKLEDCRKSTISLHNEGNSASSVDDVNVVVKLPFKQRNNISKSVDTKNDGKISLRVSRSLAPKIDKDAIKRHSWSPLSSSNNEKITQIPCQQILYDQTIEYIDKSNSFQPKSFILQRALDCDAIKSQNSSKIKLSERFRPDPLEYVRSSDDEGSFGDASQATYTLNGDNYTEEEKELMSIDKFNRSDFNLSIESLSNLTEIKSSDTKKTSYITKEKTPSQKTTELCLDKIKVHVNSIGDCTTKGTKKQGISKNGSLCSQMLYADNKSGKELDLGTFTR